MESGLEDRNNPFFHQEQEKPEKVSMESGLEDRNNLIRLAININQNSASQWSPA